MKRVLIFGMVLLAPVLSRAEEGFGEKSLVQNQSDNVRFYGDKIMIKVNAGAEEVEKYLLDGRHLILWSVLDHPRIVGNDRFEKLGDRMRVEGRMFGIPLWFEMTLVARQPGEELLYLYRLSTGGMGFLQFLLEPMGGGTRITKKAGNQLPSAGLGEILDRLKFQDRARRASEEALAQLQAYFDPGLNTEELLSQGVRGEVYDMFFLDYQAEVKIKASGEKVIQALENPRNWKILKDQSELSLGCLSSGKERVCPMKLNLLGTEYQIDFFPFFSKSGRFDSGYLVFKGVMARIKVSVKPGPGVTKVRLDYLTEVPSPISPEALNYLIKMDQLPRLMEQLLVELKALAEGPDKPLEGQAEEIFCARDN